MRRLVIALSLSLVSTSLTAQSPSAYRITHTYTLGGDGSWDYTSPTRRSIASSSAARIV